MRIMQIGAKNFRCLTDVDLELRPFTVVIGPNGAGKSTLLDILHVLSSEHQGPNLQAAIARLGGFDATIWQRAREPVVSFAIGLGDNNPMWLYDFTLREERGSFYVEEERLRTSKKTGGDEWFRRHDAQVYWMTRGRVENKHGCSHGPFLVLQQFVQQIDPDNHIFEALERTSLWPVHQFQLNDRTRGPQQLQPVKLPAKDGSDLLSALYTLKTERRKTFGDLLEAMRGAIPELQEIEFPLAGAGT